MAFCTSVEPAIADVVVINNLPIGDAPNPPPPIGGPPPFSRADRGDVQNQDAKGMIYRIFPFQGGRRNAREACPPLKRAGDHAQHGGGLGAAAWLISVPDSDRPRPLTLRRSFLG